MNIKSILILVMALTLAGCKSTPDPVEEPVVDINLGPVQTCVPIEVLTKVDVPEVTETYYTIVLIDNPPYEPIERKEEVTHIVEPARIAYVDGEGQEVVDICPEPATTVTG